MPKQGHEGAREARGALSPEAKYLEPPKGFTVAKRKIWEEVVRDFPPTHFRPSDASTLESYVNIRHDLNKLRKLLAKEGLIIENFRGDPAEHPACTVANKLATSLLSHARALKICPSARIQDTQVPKVSETRKREVEDQTKGRRKMRLVG